LVAWQKRMLFTLMKIQKANKSLKIEELADFIVSIQTEMSAEDVAWVEKQVAKL